MSRVKSKDELFQELYNLARNAGLEAVNKQIQENDVALMRVVQRENPLNDNSPVVKDYGIVPVCGFAWVNIKPGNSAFARWMKEQNLARTDSYFGGVSMSVSDFNQSVSLKETFAYAFARVLNENGIQAFAHSRLD